ncbi:MAG: glutamate 5-kinase [Ferrimicrobium sp.]
MRRRVVVKIGTSSLTDENGSLQTPVVVDLVQQVAAIASDVDIVLVVSGAIALGLAELGLRRPQEVAVLQAASAVGQIQLVGAFRRSFVDAGLTVGQLLLAPSDFGDRRQYLHARSTIEALIGRGVIPIINENDAVASDEIRFGDNDRIAALVANVVRAQLLVLLTDTDGLFTADPRIDPEASLIEEVDATAADRAAVVGGAGSQRGSGGMASKLQAARIASHSGLECVIAASSRPNVIVDAVGGLGVGTVIRRSPRRESARHLWIAFATVPEGKIVIDAGARRALVERGASLLSVGVVRVEGSFHAGAAVEVTDTDGLRCARGIVRYDSRSIRGAEGEVIHRDDLVILDTESSRSGR